MSTAQLDMVSHLHIAVRVMVRTLQLSPDEAWSAVAEAYSRDYSVARSDVEDVKERVLAE
jgi:hypothetical protein